MTPQTNNAYYEPTLNEICFRRVAILQPPFFDEKADDATNFGAIGRTTIGHELTHGFDDQGRQYDLGGQLEEPGGPMTTPRRLDSASLAWARSNTTPSRCSPGCTSAASRCSSEKQLLTSADFRICCYAAGVETRRQGRRRLRLIWRSTTPTRRFFIAFAQSWRTIERPEAVRLHVASDVHSPVRWRVLGSIANFPEFRAAFGCKKPAESWPSIW